MSLCPDSNNGGDHEEYLSEHNTDTKQSADEDDEWPETAEEESEMVEERSRYKPKCNR